MKLQEMKMGDRSCYFVTLPLAIVLGKKWQKGQQLQVEFSRQGDLVLKEVKNEL